MADIFFYGQVQGFEPARKEGRTKGYLKMYDRMTKRNFQCGITIDIDESSIPETSQQWVLSGVVIADGSRGVYMTCDSISVVSPEKSRQRAAAGAENGS